MKRKKVLIGSFVFLLLLVALAAGLWWVVTGSGAPQRSGRATLTGLAATATVRFDGWGVPHVEAQSIEDAFAALGWLHANDRMDQLELGRRAAAGRLAEVVGAAAVPLDRSARVLRLRRTAERLAQAASPESSRLLEAYARGVNAWLETRGSDLPPTLRLLRIDPEPWQPADSLSFALLMARDLSFWQGRPEEQRYEWLRVFGPERLRELLGEPDLHVPDAVLERARKDATTSPGMPGAWAARSQAFAPWDLEAPWTAEAAALGSNGWMLGPAWTASGAPLVVNDPHLGLALPSVWYQALLRAPGYEVSGMTLPGLPGVVIGRTAHLAWAFTNTMLDDHDLYLEELDPTGTKVRRGEGWAAITVEKETIAVKGGEAVEFELRSTDRGPLLRAAPEYGWPDRSLAWIAYEPGDAVAALLGLARASTLEEIPAAIGGHTAPAQNLMVAHEDGRLLYVTLGRVPERTKGDGRMFAPGWDASYAWSGLRPTTSNPMMLDPAEGLIVTANDDSVAAGYALPFTADFDTPYRAERIRQLLTARKGWTLAEQGELQVDEVSLWAMELVRQAEGSYEGDAAKAYAALTAWDGRMAETGAAALFDVFQEALQEAVFGDEEQMWKVQPLRGRDRLLRVLNGEATAEWFDKVDTGTVEDRKAAFSRALERAWQEGSRRWGEDVRTWPYGQAVHSLELHHPAGTLPLVGGWFNRGPFPMGGSATSVNALGGAWLGDRRHVSFGPSMRWLVDFANAESGLAILPGGQSGHPGDPHYDDQLPLYLTGTLRPAPWSEPAIAAATVSTLELVPAGGQP